MQFNWFLFLKKHNLFILILLIAFFLRTYRLDFLTTFGHDQGVDFLTVREMILTHHLTLIGIKTSLAEFFQGPLYLYLLLPFFWIMNMNLLAGPVAAVAISLITLCLLYTVLVKFSGIRAGIIGAAIFTVSPQFIQYGNTPLYQHFTPLFYIICIYFLYCSTVDKHNIRYAFLASLFAGLSLELHFLSISLALTILIIIILNKTDKLKSILAFLMGFIVGLIPTILFEVRHNFLNTRYLFQYLSSYSGPTADLPSKLMAWINGASTFFGAENRLEGILILMIICFILTRKESSKSFIFIRKIDLILLFISFIFCFKLSSFWWWYPLPFWVASLLLISIYFANHLTNKLILTIFSLIIISNLYFSLSIMNNNHGFYMPPGWSLRKIDTIAKVIAEDTVGDMGNFNVISFLDNTRAYPLRYALEIRGKTPGKVTDYNQNNALYIVSSDNIDKVMSSKIWELQEFSPFRFGNSWNMEDNIFLYRLDKIR